MQKNPTSASATRVERGHASTRGFLPLEPLRAPSNLVDISGLSVDWIADETADGHEEIKRYLTAQGVDVQTHDAECDLNTLNIKK